MFTPESPFSIGANLPWIRYGGDFGTNAWWPDGGLSAAGVPDQVRARVGELREHGVTAIRWFLFCDGRAGIRFSGDGTPTAFDDRLLPDLDVAVTFAADAGVRIMFTLFDFLWCAPRAAAGGVSIHGHRTVLADERQRAALIERVVAPVLERYGRHTAVCAWDVMNEPEWMTFGLGAWNPWRSVPVAAMRAFIADVAALVHRTTMHPVTVGLASGRWLDLVRGTGLDFYQVHWYDRLDRRAPLHRSVDRLRLDKPVILGEYPTRGSRRPPEVILRQAREAGYSGAWLWSVQATDKASDYDAGLAALDRFHRADLAGPATGLESAHP
jgi:hypothetical protein